MLLLVASAGIAAEPDNTIRIQADVLEADIEGDTAEFSGNVKIDRGEARITADHLKELVEAKKFENELTTALR